MQAILKKLIIFATLSFILLQSHLCISSPLTKDCAQFLVLRSHFKSPQLLNRHLSDLRKNFLIRSDLLKSQLSASSIINSYDYLVIGAGAAAAEFILKTNQLNPQAKILVIEQTSFFSNVFDQHQNFYRLTTPSTPANDENSIPSAQYPAHYFRTLKSIRLSKYPYPFELAGHILAAHDQAHADYLFNSKILAAQTLEAENSDSYYLITLNQNLKVKAKTLIFATGLGPAKLLPQENTELKTWDEPKVFTFESLIQFSLEQQAQGHNPLNYFANKRIGLIGRGIASYNVLDFLLGQSALTLPKILWTGVARENLIKLSHDKNQRYQDLIDLILNLKSNVVELNPALTTKITSIDHQQFLLEPIQQKVDLVILATGNQNQLTANIQQIFQNQSLNFIPVFSAQTGQAVASQVVFNQGPAQNIYIIGAAASNYLTNFNPTLTPALIKVSQFAAELNQPPTYKNFAELTVELEQQIIAEQFRNKQTQPLTQPEIIFLAGIPGSGKTTWLQKQLSQQRYLLNQTVLVDPDLIRPLIPGYHHLMQTQPTLAAPWSHNAATAVQVPLVQAALKRGLNLMVDGTFKNLPFFKFLIQKIRAEHSNYKIKIIYFDCDPQTAQQRIDQRFKNTKRWVPPFDLASLAQQLRNNVIELTPFAHQVITLQSD